VAKYRRDEIAFNLKYYINNGVIERNIEMNLSGSE
jgi:hypothetical protein